MNYRLDHVAFNCANLDDAVRYAALIPGAAHGAVEVRPIMVFDR